MSQKYTNGKGNNRRINPKKDTPREAELRNKMHPGHANTQPSPIKTKEKWTPFPSPSPTLRKMPKQD